MRAVDAMMECLKAEGVDSVFGIPGGANLPTYDALYDAGVRHIQCRHEQGAGHAAEGYAKASGRVGVALATSGPGATNQITPIADAMMDSVPTVFQTGQVRPDGWWQRMRAPAPPARAMSTDRRQRRQRLTSMRVRADRARRG